MYRIHIGIAALDKVHSVCQRHFQSFAMKCCYGRKRRVCFRKAREVVKLEWLVGLTVNVIVDTDQGWLCEAKRLLGRRDQRKHQACRSRLWDCKTPNLRLREKWKRAGSEEAGGLLYQQKLGPHSTWKIRCPTVIWNENDRMAKWKVMEWSLSTGFCQC